MFFTAWFHFCFLLVLFALVNCNGSTPTQAQATVTRKFACAFISTRVEKCMDRIIIARLLLQIPCMPGTHAELHTCSNSGHKAGKIGWHSWTSDGQRACYQDSTVSAASGRIRPSGQNFDNHGIARPLGTPHMSVKTLVRYLLHTDSTPSRTVPISYSYSASAGVRMTERTCYEPM